MAKKAKTNIATEGYTAIQAGEILPPAKGTKPPTTTGKSRKHSDRVTNIQVGNGRIGLQAHTVLGDLQIEM